MPSARSTRTLVLGVTWLARYGPLGTARHA